MSPLTLDTLVGKAWLDHHLETFAKSVLGYVPTIHTADPFLQPSLLSSIRQEKALQALMELWAEAKRRSKGRTLLMPGRDAWTFEILARLEGVKSIFRPELSSPVTQWAMHHDPQREEFKLCYGLDSCCGGSVPKRLGCVDYGQVYHSGMYVSPDAGHQLLPYTGPLASYRQNWSGWMEGLPKYWKRGTIVDDFGNLCDPTHPKARPFQELNKDPGNVLSAALEVIVIADHWMKHIEPTLVKPRAEQMVKLKRAMRLLKTRKKIGTSIALKRRRRLLS